MEKSCTWAETHPLLLEYHDTVWGTPVHDDRLLFEFLVLESVPAGLSWLTVLKEREEYRKAFDNFEPKIIAAYDSGKIEELMSNQKIIRNRLKIEAAIQNTRAFLVVQKEFGSFDAYAWTYLGGKPMKNAWKSETKIPAQTRESIKPSNDLEIREFKAYNLLYFYAGCGHGA